VTPSFTELSNTSSIGYGETAARVGVAALPRGPPQVARSLCPPPRFDQATRVANAFSNAIKPEPYDPERPETPRASRPEPPRDGFSLRGCARDVHVREQCLSAPARSQVVDFLAQRALLVFGGRAALHK
jgi:hypothetical protein